MLSEDCLKAQRVATQVFMRSSVVTTQGAQTKSSGARWQVRLKHQKSYCICRILVKTSLSVEVANDLDIFSPNQHESIPVCINNWREERARRKMPARSRSHDEGIPDQEPTVNVNWYQVVMNHCAALYCQPGRPSPKGAWPARLTRSLAAFQSAESNGSCFSSLTPTLRRASGKIDQKERHSRRGTNRSTRREGAVSVALLNQD